eukprot:3715841-Prymnesium_polylepis.1
MSEVDRELMVLGVSTREGVKSSLAKRYAVRSAPLTLGTLHPAKLNRTLYGLRRLEGSVSALGRRRARRGRRRPTHSEQRVARARNVRRHYWVRPRVAAAQSSVPSPRLATRLAYHFSTANTVESSVCSGGSGGSHVSHTGQANMASSMSSVVSPSKGSSSAF